MEIWRDSFFFGWHFGTDDYFRDFGLRMLFLVFGGCDGVGLHMVCLV